MIIFFMMFSVTQAAGCMQDEKTMKTWDRVQSTPTRDYSVLGGYILGALMLGWIQIGILVVSSRYIFHINWGSSPLGIAVLFTCFLLAIIGFGAALSSFVKTKSQLSVLIPIITVPTCMLAGCMWPRELMPDIMIRIADFIPQTWVLKGMTDLVARGSDINAILMPSAVLLIFAAVFFITGITFLSVQNKK
jgi:ABC-2 type transport system permease protein